MSISHAAIEIRDLSFQYGSESVLESISLTVNRGDILGLIGPNGSGKTTLLKLIVGLLPLQSGTIRILGHDATKTHARAHIGYVRQRARDFDRNFPASVEEIVKMGRLPRLSRWHVWNRADSDAVRQAMSAVEVLELCRRPIGELSGGQQQRVLLARVLAQEPELLLLDEPTAAVDPKAEAEFYRLLGKLNREVGLTIVLVSHDIEAIATQVTKIACLNRKLLFCGQPQECLASELLERVYAGRKFVRHQHAWGAE